MEQTIKTIIDLPGAFEILKARGIKFNQSMVVQQFDISKPTLNLWLKESPFAVNLMNYCLKHSEKDFPAIMKSISGLDKALDFVLGFCNSTGLTFNEIVKEV